ncbi:MAG: hypothetical protein ACREMR_02235, partial [Gemmatimonadales bacterium]
AIDVLDEACAHAQATARVSPELEHLIRERRRVDAAIRRGSPQEAGEPGASDIGLDIFPMLERIGAEIEKLLGGPGRPKTAQDGPGTTETQPVPSSAVLDRPHPSLADRRAELDELLRAELERQGIVVTGREVARVVAAGAGKGIEWAG